MFNLANKLSYYCLSTMKYNNKTRNLYEILKISRNATSQEIKSSYYKLAKQYHPDTHQKNQKYAEIFKEINQAYNVLKDSGKRKQYDEQNYTENGEKKQYKFYNTQHNYGYGAGQKTSYNTQNTKKNPYQTTNPFESSFHSQNPYKQTSSGNTTNPYNNDFGRAFKSTQQFDQFVRNQHRKNVQQNKKLAMQRLKRSNGIVIIIIGLVSVWIVGEITFKIYEFNSHYRVRSYPEKLDPRELREYEMMMQSKVRKDYY